MSIDWTHFTPWSSLAGGLILGLAAAAFILLRGRVLGISSILAGLLHPTREGPAWRVSFLLGLVLAPLVMGFVAPGWITAPRIEASDTLLVVSGLLVGLGVRYGSGCTSGHGVCGLSMLSPRSLVATLCFMGAGFATVYVMRHWLG